MPSAKVWIQKFSSSGSKRRVFYDFRGIDGYECEEFIRKVRAYAFQKGKQDDNRWMASFAATCFSGSALRWHSGLDAAVKTDWGALEQALLAKYPHTDDTDPFRRSTIPTPAAVPVSAPAGGIRDSRLSPFSAFSTPEFSSVETFGEPTPNPSPQPPTPDTTSSLGLALTPSPVGKTKLPALPKVPGWPNAELPQKYLSWAQARYHYRANGDDPNEISLQKGELLEILDSSGNWWQARKSDGTEGFAPSNYLEVMSHV